MHRAAETAGVSQALLDSHQHHPLSVTLMSALYSSELQFPQLEKGDKAERREALGQCLAHSEHTQTTTTSIISLFHYYSMPLNLHLNVIPQPRMPSFPFPLFPFSSSKTQLEYLPPAFRVAPPQALRPADMLKFSWLWAAVPAPNPAL